MNNICEYLYAQVNKNPNKIFCVDNISKYTYKQAFDIALNIAFSLTQKNIKNQPILLKAERDNKTLLCILGIVLSNNYYLPISQDIDSNSLNLSYVNYQIVKNDLEQISSIYALFYDDLINTTFPKNFYSYLMQSFNQDNFLYAIYTSGSTGKPKAVLKTHDNMISFVNNFLSTFVFKEELNIANQTPLFFDASMKDVYLTMAVGGTLYFPEKTLFSMPTKLIEYLNDNKINYLCWVPSALTIIAKLNTFEYIVPKYLKYVFFVGEAFQPKYLNVWLKFLPDTKFINLYGSTEIAGVCLYHTIKSQVPEDKSIPLGKAIMNNNIFLKDSEICVESSQVAYGYLNSECADKETFLYINGKKVLRTGDYAEIDKDNNFVFLSRKDFQIKHLGYRINLQEIENEISQLPYIDSNCVLYDEQKDMIVCYYTSLNKKDNLVKDIMLALKSRLSQYKMPNRFVFLSQMPLNKNGKVDRQILKEML